MYKMLPYPPYHYGWIIEKCCSGYYGILHYRGTVKYTKNYKTYKEADKASEKMFKEF